MTIQEDSARLLYYYYKRYIEDGDCLLHSESLIKETNWEFHRLKNAVKYLEQKYIVEVSYFVGGQFLLKGLTPIGIDIAENQKEFKKNFGVEVNLLVAKFSWGVTEK